MTKENTNNAWAADSLYAKSLTYIEQMEKNIAEDWQYGLWSALSSPCVRIVVIPLKLDSK